MQERKKKEEEEERLRYEAYIASKKEEEEDEARITMETEMQLKATKAALENDKSPVNAAVMNMLENYNGSHSII